MRKLISPCCKTEKRVRIIINILQKVSVVLMSYGTLWKAFSPNRKSIITAIEIVTSLLFTQNNCSVWSPSKRVYSLLVLHNQHWKKICSIVFSIQANFPTYMFEIFWNTIDSWWSISLNFLSFLYPYFIFSGQVGGYYSPYTGGFTAAQMAAAAAAAAAQQTTQVKF